MGSAVSDLEPLIVFWRAHDALFEREEVTWWGAVVSDARYPLIRESNYARVETDRPVTLAEIEEVLLPERDRTGSPSSHVVLFHPEEQTDLIAEASTRGERIVWDLVMDAGPPAAPAFGSAASVEEITAFDDAFWWAHRDSARLFEVGGDPELDQLQAIERDVLIPAGRRWFCIREAGRPVALAALLVLDDVAFVDHVVTFPNARRRGHAGVLTRRALAEARATGASRTFLLAEPEGDAVRVYLRAGFVARGHLASWLAPLRG